MRLGIAALVVTVLASVATVASAQESAGDVAARAHFEAGRLHFDRGAYEDALREFEEAYQLSGRAELLYNLFLTTERMGDFDAAIAHLERYLTEGAPDAERRAQLEPRLENLRERRDRAVTSAVPAPEPVAPPPARREGDLLPAGIAFGIAGAALVSFAVTGGLALAEDGNLASGCGATASCSDAQVSNLSTLNLVADVSWVTAAVAAATGVVLLVVLGLPSDAETETARVVPWVAPDGSAGVAAEVRF